MMTTALLLIDIQNDYFEGGKCPLVGMDVAAERSVSLLDAFRESRLPVIHVRHEFQDPEAAFFAAGSEGALIHPLLAPVRGEPVVVKHQINSFKGTPLADLLEERGVKNVVIAGAMTHMCVDAVTRAAADLGYVCFVAHDACATMDVEFEGVKVEAHQVHAAVMAALDFAYAKVRSTQVVMEEVLLINAVKMASERWKSAFNTGNAAGCAAEYESNAVMQAKPFGAYTGTDEIKGFWEKLIADGFSDVEYIDPKITVLDHQQAVITSGWKMNKAGGVIHKELWVLQEDGSAKLREDDFEAQ